MSETETAAYYYRVGIKTAGDTEWVYNGLSFETHEDAKEYALDLSARWTAVTEWTITKVETQ